MSEVADRYSTIADGFTARVEGVQGEGWLAPSPCPEWAARDVVAHVIDTHYRILATLDGAEQPAVSPDDDLPMRWSAVTGVLVDTINDEAIASKIVKSMIGEQPFGSLVGSLLCIDTLVHTWDLARATGQDEHLDPAAVATAMGFLAPLDDVIRRPGGFGPKIESEPGADEQTKFLNFCGRAV
ncbi:MAG: TIGR03086 family metal-binding protein [Pseudonocardiaceae bacterium]